MKSPLKIFVLIVVALAVAAAGVVQLSNILASRQRESVQKELRALLGKDVSFASLDVHWFGWPGFSAKELRIADDPRFAATPIIRARELILGVRLWSLLLGRVVINALTFTEPEFQIITDETGLHNLDLLADRRKEITPMPRLRPDPKEHRQSAVIFAIEEVRIDDGRVIYLDRSVKEPAELQLRDIDMKLSGLDASKTTRLRFAAALAEGLGHDVRIEGTLYGAESEQSWLRREMNLSIQLDSLHIPVVARAIAALRDKIPRELDVTGPMALEAKATGTLARPRVEKFTLKAPVFGASDYNAIVTGNVEFSERRSWEDAQLQGNLNIDPLPVARLRNLRWFRQNLPAALTSDGTIAIYSRFEGTWETLRVGALVRADKSEWRYKEWLRKPLNRPAEIRTRIARQKQKIFFYESELASGQNRVGFTGFVDVGDEPKLQLHVANSKGSVTAWSELVAPAALVGVAGQTDLNIVIDQQSLPGDDSWNMHGYLKLSDGAFRHPPSGRKIDDTNATITFAGQQAKFEAVKFRLGGSTLEMDGVAPNLLDPNLTYRLHSTRLNLADLPPLGATPTVQLNNVSATGSLRWQDGGLILDGVLLSPEGKLYDFPFRDLRSAIVWSPAGLAFENLSLRALEGVVRGDGYLGESGRFELSTQADTLAMRALAAQLLPPIKDRVEGRFNGRAEVAVTGANDGGTRHTLKASIETMMQRGSIKDFNLVSHLLLRGSGTTVSAEATARLPPGFAKLLTPPDTTLESLKGDFTVEGERIRTDNLVIATTDYTITGAGWVGFDRKTKWNGLIALSQRASQEVQRDYRLLRYGLDRRGRFAITFRIDGTIPNVVIRLDNRALAQLLRGGAPARGGEGEVEARPGQETKDGKRWLPDALERFLNR